MTNEELIVLAHAGDKEAEERFFNQNKRFPYFMAGKFKNTKIDHEELISICTFGMLKAYKTFDPSNGAKFATYASRCMDNEVLMRMRRKSPLTISLSDVTFASDTDGSELTVEETIGEEELGYEKLETSDALHAVLQEFNQVATERQKQVLALRMESELNQDQIAEKLGISQSYISRLEKRALVRLRKIAQKHGLQGSYIKGEVKEMAFEKKMNVAAFVYLIKNYPELKNNDLAKLLGVSYPSIIQYNKKYQAGKFGDILPEPGDLDERVEEYKREYYPEQLAGPMTITQLPKLEEDVEVKLKTVEKHQEYDSIKEHYEAQQESSLKIPEETLRETKKILGAALNQPHPMVGMFPGKFEQLGQDIGKLVDKKNTAYGDSFAKTGDFLRLLYPNGIKPNQYKDALAIVRVYDKLMRIATDKDALGENPWSDVAGYALLGVVNSGR